MRALCLTLAGCIAGTSLLFGQAPNQPPAPVDPKLEQVLANWEKTMSGVTSLFAECTRKETDKAFGTTAEYTGWAKYLKSTVPNQPSRAMLKMERKGRPEIYEHLIFTGTYLYEYVPQQKLIRVHELQAGNGQLANDNILGFVFGKTAAEAKRRYHLTYQPPPANDKWYYYIGIQPKEAADKADFSQARLVVVNTSYLPRQFWYVQPNGNEVIWEFKVNDKAVINANEFATPNPPPGWRFERMVRDPQPRIIRPNQ